MKIHNFWQILTLGGSCTQPPLLMRAKFNVLQQTHGLCLHTKFSLDWFILLPSGGEKHQTLLSLGFQHFAVSPVGGHISNLNTDAQLQTFPYPMVSKSFLYSNGFMAKSCTQTLVIQKRDGHANKQTSKQTNIKLNVFGRPSGRCTITTTTNTILDFQIPLILTARCITVPYFIEIVQAVARGSRFFQFSRWQQAVILDF